MADETLTTDTTTTTETTTTDTSVDTSATDTSTDTDTSVLGGDIKDTSADTSDDKAGGDKPADEGGGDTEAPQGAPEEYAFSLKGEDGNEIELDKDMLAEAEPILRELNLTNEQANALLPLAPKIMERATNSAFQQIADAGSAMKKEWLDAFHADEQIGGPKVEETTHLAAKGLDALGFTEGHAFRTALTETGFGNHPDMIRTFRALGELVGEDGSFARSNAAGGEKPTVGWSDRYKKEG